MRSYSATLKDLRMGSICMKASRFISQSVPLTHPLSPSLTVSLLRQFALENLFQESLYDLGRTVRRGLKDRLLAAGFFDVFLELLDSSLDFVSHVGGQLHERLQ